jgi:glycosyltransferase involved in cell wall biosynthesis
VKFLTSFLKDNEIRTIITTGPPHSIHLIGLRLKKINPDLRWLADFRDPWSDWGLLDSLRVGNLARRYHKKMESEVLQAADEIITITPFYARRFETLSSRSVKLLTNGFDEEKLANLHYRKSSEFVIRHVGIVNEKCDPRPFMKAVVQLCKEQPEFARNAKVEFIGEVHPSFKTFVSEIEIVKDITVFTGNIPHRELVALYGSSSALLMVLTGYKDAEGFLPGKLFEYMATGLPILAIGPVDGDAAALLKETGAGEMIASEDLQTMKTKILSQFQSWRDHPEPVVTKAGVKKYSRKEITRTLTELLTSQDKP